MVSEPITKPKVCDEFRLNLGLDDRTSETSLVSPGEASETSLVSPGDLRMLCVLVPTRMDVLNEGVIGYIKDMDTNNNN